MNLATALPLLLGVLGAGAVLGSRKPKVDPLVPRTPSPLKFSGSLRPIGAGTFSGSFRPLAKTRFSGPLRPVEGGAVRLFGKSTAYEYPAPYRFEDAREMAAIVLRAASETSPANADRFAKLVRRTRAIDSAHIPNWRKTYALILTVIVPAFSWNLLWHWYRVKGGTSRVREDRFNAIISWAALFFSMPVTATAANTIEPGAAGSSLLPHMTAYLDPSIRLHRGNLDPREQRRCLYDVFSFMRAARVASSRGSSSIADTSSHAARRMADLNGAYPLSDPAVFVIEGNLKAIDEITWYANAIVQGSIAVDFDEGAAYVALAVRVVAVLAQAASMFVGPQVGSAINAAADAISSLASMVVAGQITSTQLQAMAGAGVSMMISQAGIRLGLEKEMQALQAAGARVT